MADIFKKQKDYKNAFTLLKQGKYDDSIVAFNGFLQTHSDSKYASNAQYWLAEANYVSKKYPQALTEFSKVIEQYPASFPANIPLPQFTPRAFSYLLSQLFFTAMCIAVWPTYSKFKFFMNKEITVIS